MMLGKNPVPVALVFIAVLAAASLVPISGADTSLTLRTFHTGGPGDPSWVILKLNVTQEGAIPHLEYRTDKLACPMTWGTHFYTGTPADAVSYNGLTFDFHAGRSGVDFYGDTPVFGEHDRKMEEDGADHCLFGGFNVDYGELPLGTVYMLEIVTGMPFESTTTFQVLGGGVSIVASSSGSTTFYLNDSDFAEGVSLVALGPPWCGAPTEVPCTEEHLNEGGEFGATAEFDRTWPITFKHHPFWSLEHHGGLSVSNASVEFPDGSFRYEKTALASQQGTNVNAHGLSQLSMGAPPGKYWFNIGADADVGTPVGPFIGPPGFFATGADLRFPDE